jgi:phospholipase B1
MLPGPFGDWTRRKMDALAAEYDQAVLQLIREWNAKRNPTFAVVW